MISFPCGITFVPILSKKRVALHLMGTLTRENCSSVVLKILIVRFMCIATLSRILNCVYYYQVATMLTCFVHPLETACDITRAASRQRECVQRTPHTYIYINYNKVYRA